MNVDYGKNLINEKRRKSNGVEKKKERINKRYEKSKSNYKNVDLNRRIRS
jgi:hypothetical protein